MLNADWSVVMVVFALLLFAVHIRLFALFNLFDLEMEWSDATTLQLIELYEKRPYLCDKVVSCDWTIAAYATLGRQNCARKLQVYTV